MIKITSPKDFHGRIECPICAKQGVSVWVYPTDVHGFETIRIQFMRRNCSCKYDANAWRKFKLLAIEAWENAM